MLQGSNTAVSNLFSYYGFRGFLHENETDLFLRLHVLDCSHAITCMYRRLDEGVSFYGSDRCRLPIHAERELCVAFQSLYYLADDPRTCPDYLKEEVRTFTRHCLCADHADRVEIVRSLAGRLLTAVERWQCRRVFMDEPDGPPSTPPDERPGTSRLSQFFIRAPNQNPRRRQMFGSRIIDLEVDCDSWGLLHERQPSRADTPGRTSSSSLDSAHGLDNGLISSVQPCSASRPPTARWNQYQRFKGRAGSVVSKVGMNTR